MARAEWFKLPTATRNVFRELLQDEPLFESAVTGRVTDKAAVLHASSRGSKYEGRRWRPDQHYVQRARQLRQEGVLPSTQRNVETEAQKAQRLARARSLIGVTSEVRRGIVLGRGGLSAPSHRGRKLQTPSCTCCSLHSRSPWLSSFSRRATLNPADNQQNVVHQNRAQGTVNRDGSHGRHGRSGGECRRTAACAAAHEQGTATPPSPAVGEPRPPRLGYTAAGSAQPWPPPSSPPLPVWVSRDARTVATAAAARF